MSSETTATSTPAKPMAFTFGEPTPVLDARGILDYLNCPISGPFYEPPIQLDGVAKLTRSNVYLQSGLIFKRNQLV
ncbi:MAG: Presumed portal vertex protein, partial [Pseudomonadota bacterium]|nr:Presumed portal vertex protein [Pseudomonadota bacterium]